MSQLGGHAAEAFDQFIAANHPTTDAGADGEINNVMMAFPGAVQPFTQDSQVGVVPYIGRNIVFL